MSPMVGVELRPVIRRRGFGLLETIVALALIAGAGMALMSWLQQSLHSAFRARNTEYEARLLLSAQALIESINPAEKAEGSLKADGLFLTWQSQPVEPPRRNATFVEGTPGPWEIGLYRLAVTALDEQSAVRVNFVQYRTGLKRLWPAEISQ
jgi:general secretion pathway protein I